MKMLLSGLVTLSGLIVVAVVMFLDAQSTTAFVGSGAPVVQQTRTVTTEVSYGTLLTESKIELQLEGGTLAQKPFVAALASAEPEAQINRPGGVRVRVLSGGHAVLICSPLGSVVDCRAFDLLTDRSFDQSASTFAAAARGAQAGLVHGR
jgi:hypothetical protein